MTDLLESFKAPVTSIKVDYSSVVQATLEKFHTLLLFENSWKRNDVSNMDVENINQFSLKALTDHVSYHLYTIGQDGYYKLQGLLYGPDKFEIRKRECFINDLLIDVKVKSLLEKVLLYDMDERIKRVIKKLFVDIPYLSNLVAFLF